MGHGDMWEDSVKIEEDKCCAPTKVSTCYSSYDETRKKREERGGGKLKERERERESQGRRMERKREERV